MEKIIQLHFNATVTRLAGYDYGRSVYETQIKDFIDYTTVTYLEFPNQIVKVASSFVQGLFSEIVKNVGMEAIGEKLLYAQLLQNLRLQSWATCYNSGAI